MYGDGLQPQGETMGKANLGGHDMAREVDTNGEALCGAGSVRVMRGAFWD